MNLLQRHRDPREACPEGPDDPESARLRPSRPRRGGFRLWPVPPLPEEVPRRRGGPDPLHLRPVPGSGLLSLARPRLHPPGGLPALRRRGFPPELRDLPLTLEAYGPDRWIVARERVVDGEVDAAIGRLLAREEVGYLHVRNTEAGCYIARVERADSQINSLKDPNFIRNLFDSRARLISSASVIVRRSLRIDSSRRPGVLRMRPGPRPCLRFSSKGPLLVGCDQRLRGERPGRGRRLLPFPGSASTRQRARARHFGERRYHRHHRGCHGDHPRASCSRALTTSARTSTGAEHPVRQTRREDPARSTNARLKRMFASTRTRRGATRDYPSISGTRGSSSSSSSPALARIASRVSPP